MVIPPAFGAAPPRHLFPNGKLVQSPFAYEMVNYLVGGFIMGIIIGAALMLMAIWISQKGTNSSPIAGPRPASKAIQYINRRRRKCPRPRAERRFLYPDVVRLDDGTRPW
jgi:hypothetical protein